jgi:hypothetical protein
MAVHAVVVCSATGHKVFGRYLEGLDADADDGPSRSHWERSLALEVESWPPAPDPDGRVRCVESSRHRSRLCGRTSGSDVLAPPRLLAHHPAWRSTYPCRALSVNGLLISRSLGGPTCRVPSCTRGDTRVSVAVVGGRLVVWKVISDLVLFVAGSHAHECDEFARASSASSPLLSPRAPSRRPSDDGCRDDKSL